MKLFILLEEADDAFKMWPKGAIIIGALGTLIILGALATFMGYRMIQDRRKYIEEKSAYIEGVLSKNEVRSNINLLISKSTEDTPFSLVLVDMDKFSQISNAFGDKASKQVIETMAQRFLKLLPFQTQLGRIDNDKFILVFRPDYEADEVYHVTEQLKEALETPIRISYDTETLVTASFAIAYYPRHGQNYKQLLDSLDVAVYTAKRNGGDKIVVYSDELGATESENRLYYEQVKAAINNKEFVLFYQPVASDVSQDFVGAEALLRWEHPTLGLLNPKDFINIMEQSGDIYWVGIWGLESMIGELNSIRIKVPSRDFSLSINLSIKQLMNDKLAQDFQTILRKYKISGKNIIIEVDEFILYNQHETIQSNIKKLRELGFRIAADGFAFDYNTLLKLSTLPLDVIKLDASFIEEDNAELMKNFVNLLMTYANKHNVEVIAYKVENLEIVNYFSELGIHKFQGYFVSAPVSENNLLEIVDDYRYVRNLFENKSMEDLQAQAAAAIEQMNAEVDQDNEETKKTKSTKKDKEEETIIEESNIEESPNLEEENTQNE